MIKLLVIEDDKTLSDNMKEIVEIGDAHKPMMAVKAYTRQKRGSMI